MKRNIWYLLVASILTLYGCGKAKEELASNIISTYSVANQEQDEVTIKELFPNIKYFEKYPKADKIIVNEMKVDSNSVMAACSLYYETELGKNIEKEIKILVNTSDSLIVDVLGYLTLDERKGIIERWYFKHFEDLKPSNNDMDAKLAMKDNIAMNRLNGYEYYALKALGDKTNVKLDVNQSNTQINLSITNNSIYDCEYQYEDENMIYTYSFPSFISSEINKIIGTEGRFLIKAGQTLTESVKVKTSYNTTIEKSKISIKPYIEAIDIVKNKEIVLKYCNQQIIDEINVGKNSFFDLGYNYKLEIK